MRNTLLLCLLSTAACVPYQPSLPPSEWDSNFQTQFENSDLSMKCHWTKATIRTQPNLPKQEKNLLFVELTKEGLTSRDLDLIFRNGIPETRWGTGMSYYGVICIGGFIVNRSFYPGLGHTWQMQVGDSYLYLEGDGEKNNMRVSSWN